MGKGEMKFLVMSNFSFSHSVFKRLVSQGRQEVSLCGNGLIARNEQLFLLPQCFLPVVNNFLLFSSNLKLLSAKSFNLEESKICRLVMSKTIRRAQHAGANAQL